MNQTSLGTRASAVVLAVLLLGFGLWHILAPDAALSYTERRRLAQLPALEWNELSDGGLASELETYLLDQFPLREQFLSLQGLLRLKLLGQSDLNGVYVSGNSAAELLTEWDSDELAYFTKRVQDVCALLGEGQRTYYAVIPDKGYYMAQEQDLPVADYDALLAQVREGLSGLEEIDLFPLLSLGDYYETDPHWRQERIGAVAESLLEAMGVPGGTTDYTAHTLSPFYGAYCGRALGLKPESLQYLTSPALERAEVTSAELEGPLAVYPTEKLGGMDGYDVFLHGAQALLTLSDPEGTSGRELVIFRDSFGSSIAPLLLEGYDRITLVDLRYLDLRLLPELLTLEDQDVLFLYNVSLINSARVLR